MQNATWSGYRKRKPWKWNAAGIVRLKVYMDRSRMYSGYVQFFMMGWLFFNSFKSSLTPIFIRHPLISGLSGFFLFIFGSMFVGWLDLKLGFFQEEAKRHSSLNPIYTEILQGIAEVNRQNKENAKRLQTIEGYVGLHPEPESNEPADPTREEAKLAAEQSFKKWLKT